MVSAALIKLSSPVARSCLMAISIMLAIDACLTILAASRYPYLIAYVDELYIQSSSSITVVYCAISVAAILISISTAVASLKRATNYVLVNACITGVFLPVSILVYFTSISSRYKVAEFVLDYRKMISEYRMSSSQVKLTGQPVTSNNASNSGNNQVVKNGTNNQVHQLHLSSFINLIDSLQTKYTCCGVDSPHDWTLQWENYIPPSCCKTIDQTTSTNSHWAELFKVESEHEFHHCEEKGAYQLGCLVALKEDEVSKYAWLADLIVFLMVMTISNTIVSLILFGLSKTENMPGYDSEENELAMVGMPNKPRPSQPEITGIRHRPSVVHTLGASQEQISAISQAVRFNISNSPRASISGPSKFSAAARRGSSFM